MGTSSDRHTRALTENILVEYQFGREFHRVTYRKGDYNRSWEFDVFQFDAMFNNDQEIIDFVERQIPKPPKDAPTNPAPGARYQAEDGRTFTWDDLEGRWRLDYPWSDGTEPRETPWRVGVDPAGPPENDSPSVDGPGNDIPYYKKLEKRFSIDRDLQTLDIIVVDHDTDEVEHFSEMDFDDQFDAKNEHLARIKLAKFFDNHTVTRYNMANKFLPFITETSTPLQIYKTILTRSKGMSIHTVSSMFYMTLMEDVDKLRNEAKELPEMPLEELYRELLNSHSKYMLNDELTELFIQVAGYLSFEDRYNWVCNEEITPVDQVMFMYVMALQDKYLRDEHMEYFALALENHEHCLTNLLDRSVNNVTFDDTGIPMEFSSIEGLKAFIVYNNFIADKPHHDPIKALLNSKSQEDDDVPF